MVGWAVLTELRKPRGERTWYGSLAGVVPYDLRVPTVARVRQRWWNPDDERLLTPHVFGVGWSINLARARHLLRDATSEPPGDPAAAPQPAPAPEPPRPD
jgi:hypothetical protein